MSIKDKYHIESIDSHLTHEWLLYKHYAKRLPSISYAFGLFDTDNKMVGVLTIGKPASPSLCNGVCGVSNSKFVYELNRLCVDDNKNKNTSSYFVGSVLKKLPPMILVSYADTKWNHHGYIYQATNWIYTGFSEIRRDKIIIGNKNHGRHSNAWENEGEWEYKDRSPKHRYVYFTGNKRFKLKWKIALVYDVYAYPKGDNERYDASYKPTTQTKLF